MDIIISAHFGPIPVCRLVSVYKSDNILSVWGLQEEEKENPGRIFLFVFIRCLWGSWKCRVAVYMAKYTLREIRHPSTFLPRRTEERQATAVNCHLCLVTHPPSQPEIPPPLNPPFPWRTQSIFNDCIDLTIGLQRTLLTAETFRSCQHFNANKSTFWHHFDRL